MTSIKYIPIDKNIIFEGASFNFSIYFPPKSNNLIKCFKKEGLTVSLDDTYVINDVSCLYIEEDSKIHYDDFYKIYTSNVIENQTVNEKFSTKTEALYSNASMALNNLFKDPTSLKNYKDSQVVVSGLVSTILDDDFTIKTIMDIAAYDYSTHTHSINVSIYALSLGLFLGLSEDSLRQLGEAGLLHDLGKSKINIEIINKKGKLEEQEFKEMQNHSTFGYELALQIGIENNSVLEAIKYHHEKMDGSGYPDALDGDKIPLFARVIAICDIFDALTSKRSYKEAMTTFDALKLMKIKMNTHLDIKLLNKMIMMFRSA